MTRLAIFLFFASVSAPLGAQLVPTPSEETPRIQSVEWRPGEPIVLTALPQTALTVMLDPGEQIVRASLASDYGWEVVIVAENDGFQVKPQAGAEMAQLSVQTSTRFYEFALEVEQSLQSAYLVRLTYGRAMRQEDELAVEETEALLWSYRLRGDRAVRPLSVKDNGDKTIIEYAPDQPLPAVFAIGPTGDEEVVDGYMREGLFVIDRVHQRLVFRIDKEKATARRNKQKETAQ